jgi:ankyrin repeat protein
MRQNDAAGPPLDHHANPNAQGHDLPLVAALDAGATHAFASLLRHGADPTGAPRQRPVIVAARAGSSATYQQLLDHGADLTVPTDAPNSATVADQALTEAASSGSLPIVNDLLTRGANPNHDSYLSPLLRSVTFATTTSRRLLGRRTNLGEADTLPLLHRPPSTPSSPPVRHHAAPRRGSGPC